MTNSEMCDDTHFERERATVRSVRKRVSLFCTNPRCRKPREAWLDERRRSNVLALTCCEACRYAKKQARDRVAIRALRAGVRAMLDEIENGGGLTPEESLRTLRSIVGADNPRVEQVWPENNGGKR